MKLPSRKFLRGHVKLMAAGAVWGFPACFGIGLPDRSRSTVEFEFRLPLGHSPIVIYNCIGILPRKGVWGGVTLKGIVGFKKGFEKESPSCSVSREVESAWRLRGPDVRRPVCRHSAATMLDCLIDVHGAAALYTPRTEDRRRSRVASGRDKSDLVGF
jgi:hypothetical protein